MINKSFIFGVVIVLLGAIGLVALPKQKEAEKGEERKLSLLDIDFRPSMSKQALDFDLSFYKKNSQGDIESLMVKLSSFKGRPVILHFWATWCKFCLPELPAYNQYVKDLSKEKVKVIMVSVDQSPAEKIIKFCNDLKLLDVDLAIDQDKNISMGLNVQSLPTTVFINAAGEEMGRIVGPVDWNDSKVRAVIKTIL